MSNVVYTTRRKDWRVTKTKRGYNVQSRILGRWNTFSGPWTLPYAKRIARDLTRRERQRNAEVEARLALEEEDFKWPPRGRRGRQCGATQQSQRC
jgi:hypothetical protein